MKTKVVLIIIGLLVLAYIIGGIVKNLPAFIIAMIVGGFLYGVFRKRK